MTLGLHVLLLAALGANPYLERGEQLFDKLAFPEAEAQLQLARKLPTSTPAERDQAADLLARARAAQGDFPGAEAVYAEELARDPHFALPTAGPKLRGLFLDAKERLYPHDYVRLEPQPAAHGELAVLVVDPWSLVAKVWLEESRQGIAQRRALALHGHVARAVLAPRTAGGAQADSYAVEALAANERLLRVLGPVVLPPLALTPEPSVVLGREAPRSHEARWVAWVVGGVSLAAAIAGTTEAVLSTRSSAAAGRSTVAVERRALDAQARAQAVPANFLIGGAIVGGVATGILAWRL